MTPDRAAITAVEDAAGLLSQQPRTGNDMTAYYLAIVATYVALGFVVGLAVGDWTARRDRRDTAARRQVLSQLLAVANVRGVRL